MHMEDSAGGTFLLCQKTSIQNGKTEKGFYSIIDDKRYMNCLGTKESHCLGTQESHCLGTHESHCLGTRVPLPRNPRVPLPRKSEDGT